MYEYAFENQKQQRALKNTNWVSRCHLSVCLAFDIVYCFLSLMSQALRWKSCTKFVILSGLDLGRLVLLQAWAWAGRMENCMEGVYSVGTP